MFITENPITGYDRLLAHAHPYFQNMRAAVVDIETTGLSPHKNEIYLIGVLHEKDDTLVVTQFLAKHPREEEKLLTAFFDLIRPYDLLLNYNGSTFDLPFILQRSKRLRLPSSLDLCRSVDYLKLFRHSYLPQLLPNLKLKSVETLAGIHRKDSLSGKECIALYRQFAETGDRHIGKQILLHNFEDLSCFPALDGLMKKIDLHYALFQTGFPVRSAGHALLFVQKIQVRRSHITVQGIFPHCPYDLAYYSEEYTLTAQKQTSLFQLEFPIDDHAFSIGAHREPVYRHINRRIMEILSALTL